MRKALFILPVLLIAALIGLNQPTSDWDGIEGSRIPTCGACNKASTLMEKIKVTHEDFLEQLEDHKRNNVQVGPTEERKAFELAQGEVYRFVCDEGKNSRTDDEKRAMLKLVLDMNKMNIDSNPMFEINGCFRAKAVSQRKLYTHLAEEEGRRGELHQLIIMNKPDSQDSRKQ